MKGMKRFVAIAVPALLVLAAGLSACDSADPETSVSASADESSADLATVLVADLGLDASQTSQIRALIEKYGNGDQPEPGFLWRVAADLQQRLTDEQMERLLEQAAEGPGSGFARGPGGHGHAFGGMQQGFRQHRRMAGGFGPLDDILTDEQKEAAQAIRESVRTDLEAIKSAVDAGTMTREEAWQKLQEIHESVRAQIEALLTDEQKAELEALRAEREAEREERRAAANSVRNEVLGLTDDEAGSFDAVSATHREAAQAIREQVRNGELSREEARDSMLALRDQRYEDLSALLNDVQLEIVQIHDALRVRARHHRSGGPGGPHMNGMQQGRGGFGMGPGSGFGFGSRG